MRRVPDRQGSSRPRIGARVGDAVLDLGALTADLARERGAARHGRGGFPRTMHELIARDPVEAEIAQIGVLTYRVVAP